MGEIEVRGEAERQALVACGRLLRKKRREPTREGLLEFGKALYGEKALDLGPALDALEARGVLSREGGRALYALGEAAMALSAELYLKQEREGFDEWLVKSAGSAAYGEYCLRVHGSTYIQFNMVDEEQTERLLAFLRLSPGDRVADLGCGIGTQAEHLSDRSGARVTGIDFAPAAIRLAAERTAPKAERLSFLVGDLNDIRLPPSSFDAVTVFDTLYFVDDLAATVAAAAGLLAPGGRLAVFYSEERLGEEAADILAPAGTRLGQALAKLGLGFETADFSANERRLWKASVEAADALKGAFEAEGNLELWKSAREEASYYVDAYEGGRAARYLYMIRR